MRGTKQKQVVPPCRFPRASVRSKGPGFARAPYLKYAETFIIPKQSKWSGTKLHTAFECSMLTFSVSTVN